MGKKVKRHAKTILSVILSLLMILGVIQFSTINLKAEGEDDFTSQDDIVQAWAEGQPY